MPKVTKHGRRRMKQRIGISKRQSEKMLQRVINHGFTHSQTLGELHSWIDKLYLSHQKANNIRLYGGMAYLLNNETLITTFPVPDALWKNKELFDKAAYNKYQQFIANKSTKSKKKVLAPWEKYDFYKAYTPDPQILEGYLENIKDYAREHCDPALGFQLLSVSQDVKFMIKAEYISSSGKNDYYRFKFIEEWFKAEYGIILSLSRRRNQDGSLVVANPSEPAEIIETTEKYGEVI